MPKLFVYTKKQWQEIKGDKPVVGVDFIIPKDGHTPTRDELIALIAPLIPNVEDGHTPTEQELLALIKPLIPRQIDQELIIQRILSALPPIPTKNDIVNSIIQILESRQKEREQTIKEDMEALKLEIRNLKLRRGGGGGGGMGNPQSQTFTGDGSTTTFTLSTNVAANGAAAWVYYNGQWLVPTTHFSISGKSLTTTFTPENGTSIDVLYIRT